MSETLKHANGSVATVDAPREPSPAPRRPRPTARPAVVPRIPEAPAAKEVEDRAPAPRTDEPRTITIRLPRLPARPALRRTAGRSPGRRRRTILVVAVWTILALALLVTDLVLSSKAADHADVDAARTQAVAAASTKVPAMLSYGYRTLNHDLATANAATTGKFHDEYDKVLQEVVKPSATSKKITTKAVATGESVVSADADHVIVLVFLTQSTTTASGQTPTVQGSRVDVTMTRSGGQWLVSALDPV